MKVSTSEEVTACFGNVEAADEDMGADTPSRNGRGGRLSGAGPRGGLGSASSSSSSHMFTPELLPMRRAVLDPLAALSQYLLILSLLACCSLFYFDLAHDPRTGASLVVQRGVSKGVPTSLRGV